MNRSHELTKNTFIITVGRISTQFISFLLLPLYTSLLSTEEYGTVDLITTLVQLFIPVVSVMIDQGVFRFLLNCETEQQKKKTVSGAFFLLTLSCLLVTVVFFIIQLFYKNEYTIWLLLILIVTAYSNLFLQVARGLKHTSDYALGSFVCSVSTIVLNVLCIAHWHMGAKGMLIATFAGNAICCVFVFLKLRIGRYIELSGIDKELIKNELKYSFPLVPNQLSLWVMNSSDRLIVTFILGTAANGVLAITHKFPAIFLTMFNIFLLAWHETGAVHYFDEDRDAFFTEMINKIISIFASLCLAVIVVLPIVFDLLVKSSFSEAYYNIPIYLIASMLNVVIGLLGVVYVATKKTAEIAKTTIIAAIINIVTNFALINIIGLYAASISTLIGYLLTLIYRVIDTKKYLKIKYEIGNIARMLMVIGIACVIYYYNNKIVSIVCLPFFVAVAYLFNKTVFQGLIALTEKKFGISKKKIVIIMIISALVFAIVGGGVVYSKIKKAPKRIEKEYSEIISELSPQKTVLFSDMGLNDITCTGLTYDIRDDSFWIGDYGSVDSKTKAKPRLIEVDHEFTHVIKTIELVDVLNTSANLQGVSYDKKEDTLWLAVGRELVQVDKSGHVIKSIAINKYATYSANGICYEEQDDSLWVLCASSYLLHYDKNGSLIKAFSFNYADQDHIYPVDDYIYATIGADYQGDNNFVCKVNKSDGVISSVFRLIGSNAIEGICIIDDKMLVINDGLYHSDLIGHSYLSVYNFNDKS